jgi:N-acetylneuraminate synthase
MMFRAAGRSVALGKPPFIIAELSGNHGGSLARALETVDAVADSGADALKLQTYTAETMTLDVDHPRFHIVDPQSLWSGRSYFDLYHEAHTPWQWHEAIFARASERGLIAFSSPFDASAVEFLARLGVPCLKIASFEITDLPLIRCAAETGLPIIISTGMATRQEIERAVAAAEGAGCEELALLWCTSAYPAPPEASALRGIPDLRDWSGKEVGLSDHTLGTAVAVASVALGATIIEKHVTLDHELETVDGAFSLDPDGLARLVRDTRTAWSALGEVTYGPSDAERSSLRFRRGLYFVRDIAAGETVGAEDVRPLRPAAVLEPDDMGRVLGRTLAESVRRGDPVSWEQLG